ncbi:hypothetical protein JDS75_27700 [Bacillus cereus]|nr:hypothetical protein [Bacillus cereus]
MTVGEVLKMLETTRSADLSKEIGISDKKLRSGLRAAGYEYRNSGDKGWHYVGEGEQPLENPIQDYVTVRTSSVNRTPKAKTTHKITHKEEVNNALTPHEVGVLREMAAQWETIKGAVSTVAATSEDEVGDGLIAKGDKIHAQHPVHTIHSLYIRVKEEIKPQKKMRKTLNVNEGVGKALDDFAAKNKLDKQDIIELALYDFFEKYGENYKDHKEKDDVKERLIGKKIRRD